MHKEREEYNTALLEEILEISKDTNKKISFLHRMEMRALIFRLIYWLIIFGVVGGVFYSLRPALESFFINFEKVQSLINSAQSIEGKIPDANNIQNIINQIKQ